MYRKIIALLLALCIVSAAAVSLSGCGSKSGKEYPVTVGDVTLDEEPKNIVVLSDCLADIVTLIGYDVKMVGRSTQCDQDFLSIVPTVGSKEEPDVNAIIGYETNLVIADDTISATAKQALKDANIPVISMLSAQSLTELEAPYVNLGALLGGNVTGRDKGQKAYKGLMSTLSDFKSTVPNSIVKTAAYLYLDESGKLCTFTSDSVEAEIFSYCCAMNVFSNQSEPAVDVSQLKMSTPTYIFYDNQAVLDYLYADPELCTLGALTGARTYQIEKKDFLRQGQTYEDMIYFMIDTMFVKGEATPDEASANQSSTENLSQSMVTPSDVSETTAN